MECITGSAKVYFLFFKSVCDGLAEKASERVRKSGLALSGRILRLKSSAQWEHQSSNSAGIVCSLCALREGNRLDLGSSGPMCWSAGTMAYLGGGDETRVGL